MFDPMEFEIDEPEKVVYVVGIGPGDVYYLTQEARNVLEHADAICGYKLYLDLIEPEFPCEEYYSTGMTKEIDRCRWALEKANTGRRVVMVCSGDAGVYGMASPVLELAQDYPDVAVEVVPGLTAALSGGAVLGAPLAQRREISVLHSIILPPRAGRTTCKRQCASCAQTARRMIPSAALCATLAARARVPGC